MSFRFGSEQIVRWVDVDSAGVVNHAVWFTLVEQARYEYCVKLGLLHAGNFPFVLAQTSARYLRPGRMGMQVRVGVRTTRLGGSSQEQEYEVRCGDELLATLEGRLVWVDAALAPREIPAAARRAIAAFEGIPERADARGA